ncbi:HNH endonuclease family protein [Sorangium sp. So ce233]|uniref:HNH endonuclease family protein n=1 Tax=Sorangium sp. So ce233 TaxID=3133290 RepID=UPI003F62B3E0
MFWGTVQASASNPDSRIEPCCLQFLGQAVLIGQRERFFIRRWPDPVCGLNTKNYNRVFLTLTRSLRRDGTTPEDVRKHLTELSGESTGWPSDEEFRVAWQERATYQTLAQPRVVHVLRRLSDALLSGKSERVSIEGPRTIEHILPQNWIEHWPLADGTAGMTSEELVSSDATDPRAVSTRRRNAAIHTLGNLTILTQALNSTVSNSAWKVKKPELLVSSLLPINQQLHAFATWDESSIEVRGRALFDVALKLWPGPTAA